MFYLLKSSLLYCRGHGQGHGHGHVYSQGHRQFICTIKINDDLASKLVQFDVGLSENLIKRAKTGRCEASMALLSANQRIFSR
jgi:hypothetical protein